MAMTCKTCNAKLEEGLESGLNEQCRLCLLEEVVMDLRKRIELIEFQTEVEER
jgi:hypothetical protein